MDVQEWKESLKEYERSKRIAPQQIKTTRVTHSSMAKLENAYHPLLQVYKDPQIESNLQEVEKLRTIEVLAKNQDRALRYEQTFNIINLDNKLKGLEGRPGYPVQKLPNYKNRKLGNTTNTDYNILSCLDLADHHYLPPEKRPKKPEVKPKTFKINTVEYRDYNIITNHYFQDHEKKANLDAESYRQEAAREYWKTHDFDPVRCAYVDLDKEEEYKNTLKEKEKVHGLDKIERLPQGIKYSEGALYQPIGMKVIDKKRLEEIDLKEKNSKSRFGNRFEIEKDYRVKDINSQDLKKSASVNKISHQRFLETAERGYNIITQAPFQGIGAEKLHLPQTVPKMSIWEKAVIDNEVQKSAPKYSTTLKTVRSRGFF